jgi:alkylation response protein AidB-like acyl-CoA dehydrogenase
MANSAGLSPEMREMFIQTMKQVFERDLPESKLLELDEADECPVDFIKTLLSPEVGLHLVFLPEEAGGLGGGAMDIARVSEEMAKIDLGVATAFLAISLGTDPIIVGGTPEQKKYWLTRIASEGLIVAYSVTEPGAGSNVASIETRADRVLDDEGNITHYKINGTKQFISNGAISQLYTILAKTPEGPSFFCVERGTEGLQVGKHEDKHGIRASDTAGVILEDVVVPVENLIGGVEGVGLKQANAVFGYTRLMVGAFGLGAGQAAIDKALAYAKERIQFGTALVEKEGYMAKLITRNWLKLEACRAYSEEVANRIDLGENNLQVEGAVAKYWSTEIGNSVADDAIQALGGYGYTREYMIEKIRRDVRITTIYEGTSEILQSVIGMNRWKETVRSKGEYYNKMAEEMVELDRSNSDVGAGITGAALRDLNSVIQFCHANKTIRKQPVMFRLADMMTQCEIAAAFCRKSAVNADTKQHLSAMSRCFARNTLADVYAGAAECCAGYVAEDENVSEILNGLESSNPMPANAGQLSDLQVVSAWLREKD